MFFYETLVMRFESEKETVLKYALDFLEIHLEDLCDVLLMQFLEVYEQFGESVFYQRLEVIADDEENRGRKYRANTKAYNRKRIKMLKLLIQEADWKDGELSPIAEFLINEFLKDFKRNPAEFKNIFKKAM